MAEPPFGHESPTIDVQRILQVGAIVLVALLVAVTALYYILNRGVMPHYPQAVTRPGVIPPAPHLQAHPDRDLVALRAEKRALLSTYAWVEPSHAFARIPIQRAMEIYNREHAATKSDDSAQPYPPAETDR